MKKASSDSPSLRRARGDPSRWSCICSEEQVVRSATVWSVCQTVRLAPDRRIRRGSCENLATDAPDRTGLGPPRGRNACCSVFKDRATGHDRGRPSSLTSAHLRGLRRGGRPRSSEDRRGVRRGGAAHAGHRAPRYVSVDPCSWEVEEVSQAIRRPLGGRVPPERSWREYHPEAARSRRSGSG